MPERDPATSLELYGWRYCGGRLFDIDKKGMC